MLMAEFLLGNNMCASHSLATLLNYGLSLGTQKAYDFLSLGFSEPTIICMTTAHVLPDTDMKSPWA